ncbi:hypothetical protein IV500_08240 [Paeniglutamicibacter antarcticus]|uniref:Uncharacterized protein n=1 Tax=Arthrobacter terrae TaxID=2935737 RepID=A0A931GA57_9MICC|nr:hypothetical protein [Arthrobacter terrae]MBG0739377.1 hypothetical protein [Arthrobacter terrae]
MTAMVQQYRSHMPLTQRYGADPVAACPGACSGDTGSARLSKNTALIIEEVYSIAEFIVPAELGIGPSGEAVAVECAQASPRSRKYFNLGKDALGRFE